MHHEIYFRSAQAAENGDYEDLRPASGRLDKVWDGYEDGMLLAEVGATEELIYKFYQARIDQGSNQGAIFTKTEKGCLLYNDLRDIQPADTESFWTIFRLSLWTDEALEKFKFQFGIWLGELVLKADSVGGDDSTYDYYPDRWDVAAQLAEALGMEVGYRTSRDLITTNGGRYSEEDLPEYIPEL